MVRREKYDQWHIADEVLQLRADRLCITRALPSEYPLRRTYYYYAGWHDTSFIERVAQGTSTTPTASHGYGGAKNRRAQRFITIIGLLPACSSSLPACTSRRRPTVSP